MRKIGENLTGESFKLTFDAMAGLFETVDDLRLNDGCELHIYGYGKDGEEIEYFEYCSMSKEELDKAAVHYGFHFKYQYRHTLYYSKVEDRKDFIDLDGIDYFVSESQL